jgi:5-formyltetrahydrofolate cyclo-ligase
MNNFISRILAFFPSYSKRIVKRKHAIRQQMRLLIEKKSEEEKKKEAVIVFNKIELLEQFKTANSILLYWSTKNEIPTHDFIAKWGDKKKILLPSVVGNDIVIKQYTDRMRKGALGIWEPDTEDQYFGEIDLAIIPGVAFDGKRNRMGRGRGFYDRFLSNHKCTKIGICFDIQILTRIPTNSNDKKMDWVISPNESIYGLN